MCMKGGNLYQQHVIPSHSNAYHVTVCQSFQESNAARWG